MLAALSHGQQILARDVAKGDGPFICPACKGTVLVKKGQIKIHHFAHQPPNDCRYGEGESEEHRRAKIAIYDALRMHPDVTMAQLERPLGKVRPDVSCYIHGKPVAIEVQLSTLGLTEIDRRTRAYHDLGIYVLWTPPYSDKLEYKDLYNNPRYSPSAWEKYIHALYFGSIFYWWEDSTVRPVHFDGFQIFFEASHDSDGNDVGGYDYPSKRYRTPKIGPCISLLDFAAQRREAWIGHETKIPAAHLWTKAKS